VDHGVDPQTWLAERDGQGGSFESESGSPAAPAPAGSKKKAAKSAPAHPAELRNEAPGYGPAAASASAPAEDPWASSGSGFSAEYGTGEFGSSSEFSGPDFGPQRDFGAPSDFGTANFSAVPYADVDHGASEPDSTDHDDGRGASQLPRSYGGPPSQPKGLAAKAAMSKVTSSLSGLGRGKLAKRPSFLRPGYQDAGTPEQVGYQDAEFQDPEFPEAAGHDGAYRESEYTQPSYPPEYTQPSYPPEYTQPSYPPEYPQPAYQHNGGSTPAATATTALVSKASIRRRPKASGLQAADPQTAAGTRRAQLVLSRIEPWSVMKFSFLISLVGFVILFVAVAALYYLLQKLGVFTTIESTVAQVTSSKTSAGTNAASWFAAKRVLGYTMAVAGINVFIITALATVGAVIYNLVTHLAGGIEVTLRETD